MAEKQTVDQGLDALSSILSTLSAPLADAIRDAMKQGARELNPSRENPNYVPDSIYTPKGVEKPLLRCRTFFKQMEQDAALLTPDEVKLFNTLVPGDYPLKIHGVTKLFRVFTKLDGNSEELHVDFPLSSEERATMPGMVRLLRALQAGVTELED